MVSPVPRLATTAPGGRRHSHKWTRQRVVMPRELVMGDTQLQEQMQAHVRQFMAGKDSAMQERIVLEPNLDPEAKFLSHACLPRVYAESWTRQVARHYQQIPKESEFALKRTPRPKHDGAFCCVVESPTSLLVVMADGKTEKVPPRTWLMLEPPPSAFRTRPSATVSPEGEADLEAFVTSFGTCPSQELQAEAGWRGSRA